MSGLETSLRQQESTKRRDNVGSFGDASAKPKSQILKPIKTSRIWFELHSWVGFKLSLFMSFILITGTFAVISNELDWLTHSSMRVTPQADSQKASWGEIYESLVTTYPDWQFPYIREAIDPWFALYVQATTPEGKLRLVDVNPYTAEVQGDRPWLSFQRFFRNTHRHLMLPTKIGVPIVSALSILLLISLVTGLLVYKKFWQGFFKLPRYKKNRRIYYGDLHRLAGLWSIWFLLVVALTGLFYLAESLGWRAPSFGKIEKAETVANVINGETIDRYVDIAKQALPGFRITLVLPPSKAGDSIIFQGYTDDTWLVRVRASYVAIDPANGKILGSHRSANANLHQRISEMADPLHFGYFGGLGVKLIWFAFGILLSALSITGVVIYATRIQRSIRATPSRNDCNTNTASSNNTCCETPVQTPYSKFKGLMELCWRDMGIWKWTGVLAIIIVVCLLPKTANADQLNHDTAQFFNIHC